MPNALLYGSLALVLLVVAGFWPTYLSQPASGIDGYTHFHAAVGAGCLAILVVQPLLIARGRLALGCIVYALAHTLASRPADHRIFARFAIAFMAVLVLWFFVPETPPWMAFAGWFRSLPLT